MELDIIAPITKESGRVIVPTGEERYVFSLRTFAD